MKPPEYPTEITEEVLAKASHISDEELERDIFDTRAELHAIKRKAAAYAELADAQADPMKRRMSHFRATAGKQSAVRCEKFLTFMEALEAKRKEVKEDAPA